MGNWTTTVRRMIPRRHLHRVLNLGKQITGLFYYGNRMECPVCGKKARKFMPYGITKRPNAMCPHCFSLERHRLMWIYLQRETDLFISKPKLLHVAPERCFMKSLEQQLGDNYITADLNSPLAKVKMNIQDIQFPDGEFDVIFCNHVLEHVDDDMQAMGEFHRVMKPGGWGIMLVPINYRRETTYEDPAITGKKEREKAFGQWDHVREYGRDYPERLRKAGFEVSAIDYSKTFTPEEQAYYSLGGDTLYVVGKQL